MEGIVKEIIVAVRGFEIYFGGKLMVLVMSRKLMLVLEISCVNWIDGWKLET
jgi:hypothetical protein